MYYKKKIQLFIMVTMIVLIYGCHSREAVMLTEANASYIAEGDLEQVTDEPADKESFIYVYISGEVKEPGVYQMLEDARIYEVLTEAGGYTFEADENVLNLAGEMVDGMQIHVPNLYEQSDVEGTIDSLEQVENTDGKVNLNTASQSDLESIPGIGQVKAELILSYRRDHGNFSSIEDIMQVDGIKEGTFEKIKDYIKVMN